MVSLLGLLRFSSQFLASCLSLFSFRFSALQTEEVVWLGDAMPLCLQVRKQRQCFAYYVDFHRCNELMGKDYKPCKFFQNVYKVSYFVLYLLFSHSLMRYSFSSTMYVLNCLLSHTFQKFRNLCKFMVSKIFHVAVATVLPVFCLSRLTQIFRSRFSDI